MNPQDYSSQALAEALGLIGQGIQTQAMRPQKTSQTTVSTTKPIEYADMLARRNQIGAERQALADALKKRENFGYSLASALSAIPQQQGYGSWLSDLGRSFGAGFNARTNAAIDRAQQDYEAAQKDLADALALDKAMGDVQTQTQTIDYTPMEYGTAGAKAQQGQTAGLQAVGGAPLENVGRSVGYDPVENIPDYGPLTRAALSEEELGLAKYIPFVQSTIKASVPQKDIESLQTLQSDIAENIVSGKVLDFVGKAGSVRVADTQDERNAIFGPLIDYQKMNPGQLRTAIDQSRNKFVSLGLQKAKAAGVEISAEELKNWYNSMFTVPRSMKQTETMYNIQDRPVQQPEQPAVDINSLLNKHGIKVVE